MVLLDMTSITEFICPPVLGLIVEKGTIRRQENDLLVKPQSPGSEIYNLSFSSHLPFSLPSRILDSVRRDSCFLFVAGDAHLKYN
jgi:hypothetical protein